MIGPGTGFSEPVVKNFSVGFKFEVEFRKVYSYN